LVRPSFGEIWRETHAASAIRAGIAAAIPAAMVSALVLVVAPSATFRAIGRLIAPAAEPRLLWWSAVFVHLTLSLFFGAIWGFLVAMTAHHLRPMGGLVWGALYGVGIWLVGFVLLLPHLGPELAVRTRVGLAWHLLYGATLGACFHAARRRERQRHVRISSSRGPSPDRALAGPEESGRPHR